MTDRLVSFGEPGPPGPPGTFTPPEGRGILAADGLGNVFLIASGTAQQLLSVKDDGTFAFVTVDQLPIGDLAHDQMYVQYIDGTGYVLSPAPEVFPNPGSGTPSVPIVTDGVVTIFNLGSPKQIARVNTGGDGIEFVSMSALFGTTGLTTGSVVDVDTTKVPLLVAGDVDHSKLPNLILSAVESTSAVPSKVEASATLSSTATTAPGTTMLTKTITALSVGDMIEIDINLNMSAALVNVVVTISGASGTNTWTQAIASTTNISIKDLFTCTAAGSHTIVVSTYAISTFTVTNRRLVTKVIRP